MECNAYRRFFPPVSGKRPHTFFTYKETGRKRKREAKKTLFLYLKGREQGQNSLFLAGSVILSFSQTSTLFYVSMFFSALLSLLFPRMASHHSYSQAFKCCYINASQCFCILSCDQFLLHTLTNRFSAGIKRNVLFVQSFWSFSVRPFPYTFSWFTVPQQSFPASHVDHLKGHRKFV